MNIRGESLLCYCNALDLCIGCMTPGVSKAENLFFWSLGGKTWMGTMTFVNAVMVPVLRSGTLGPIRDTFLVKMCCVAPENH